MLFLNACHLCPFEVSKYFLVTLLMLNNKGLWIRTWLTCFRCRTCLFVSAGFNGKLSWCYDPNSEKAPLSLSQHRVQDHGELLSALPVSRQPLEVRRTDADEWKLSLVARAISPLCLPSIREKCKIDVTLLHLSTLLDRCPCTGTAYIWSKQTNALLNRNQSLISHKSMLFAEVTLARPCLSHFVSRCAWAFTPDLHI